MLRGRIISVIVALLCACLPGWCAGPEQKVADKEYEMKVTEIRDKLAETFPLMALIEVRIIEVLLDASADLGFFYQLISNSPDREGEIGFLKESEIDLRTLSSGDPGIRMMGVLGETAESQINAAIEALASQRRVSIMAEPSVLTLMGHTAAIQSGDEIPYIRRVVVGNTETISSQYQSTGVSMWVLPNVVDRDGNRFINLELYTSVNTVTRYREEEGYQQPIIDTREYHTTVELRSGQYVALGGIYRSVVSHTRRGIPGLMNVPIIGWAARATSEKSTQSELLILVHPRIVNLEESEIVDLGTSRVSSDEQRRFLRGGQGNRRDWFHQTTGMNAGGKR